MDPEDDTPCIGICIIGPDGRCEGCGRTEEEIWGVPELAAPLPIKEPPPPDETR